MWCLSIFLSILLVPALSKEQPCSKEHVAVNDLTKKLEEEYNYSLPAEAMDLQCNAYMDVMQCYWHNSSMKNENNHMIGHTMGILEIYKTQKISRGPFCKCFQKLDYDKTGMIRGKMHNYAMTRQQDRRGMAFEVFMELEGLIRVNCDKDAWMDMIKNMDSIGKAC